MERKFTDVDSFANSLHIRIDNPDIDKQFDDAFIEDADQNNTILDDSCEAVIDKSIKCLNNSSSTADYLDILHWPLKDHNSMNSSELSSENFCIWEIAGVAQKLMEKTVCESENQAILRECDTTKMSPVGLKDSPCRISTETKNCKVKLRQMLLPCDDSSGNKTGTFSSSLASLACGELSSSDIAQSQPLKSKLEAESDITNTDNHVRGKRHFNSFHEKKLLTDRARLAKKRTWQHNDVPRKRKCLDPSVATFGPLVNLVDNPSGILLDPNEGVVTDKDILLTSSNSPNSSTTQSLPSSTPLQTVIDTVNADSLIKSERMAKPYSEKIILTDSRKAANVLQRKHVGQFVDEALVGGQSLSESETCVIVNFPLSSDENIQISRLHDISMHNEHLNKTNQPNDVSDDVITIWTPPAASDEDLQLISYDLAYSNSDAHKQNCLWEVYRGKQLFSVPRSESVLANAAVELSNAALTSELKNWDPFSTYALSQTSGAGKADAEMAMQESAASETSVASTQLLGDGLRPAKKKKGRKSMSADREIANQMEKISPQKSDSSQTFPRKRYPLRLRRRYSESFQFTQNEDVCAGVQETSVTVATAGSQPEHNLPKAGNEIVNSGDEPTFDLDASILDADFNVCSIPAKRSCRLRRKSTELYRFSRNNGQPLLASVEEMPEQQESTVSWKVQNDLVNIELKRQRNGMNKSSNSSKQKKYKSEEGPPLEDIYLNRLWRSQMPKEVLWETIPEDPKYNKETGSLRLFSVRKAKRLLDFEGGPSILRLKSRKLKAMKLGWKPLTKKKETALSKVLMQKLSRLDEEIRVG